MEIRRAGCLEKHFAQSKAAIQVRIFLSPTSTRDPAKSKAIEFTTDGTPIFTDISLFGDHPCVIGGKM
jgi:hypothetical protein